MPVENYVSLVKDMLADHIDFAATTLLGRSTIDNDRTLMARLLQPFAYRNSTCSRTYSEDIMSTSMTRATGYQWFTIGNGILTQSRQCIVFCQNANDRFAMSVARYKRCRHIGHARFNAETGLT